MSNDELGANITGLAADFLSSPLSKFRPWVDPATGRSPQREFLQASQYFPNKLFRAGNRSGKGLRLDEPVFTPSGWRQAGDIREGDTLFSETGEPTVVTEVFLRRDVETFRVTFNDGTSVVCDEDHLWKVKDRNGRFAPDASRRSDPAHFGRWRVLPLHEIRRRWGDRPKPVNRVSVPLAAPIQLPDMSLPLDPYLLGALLGDGSMVGSSVRFTSADQEIVDRVRSSLPFGHELKPSGKDIDYLVTGSEREGSRRVNRVLDALRALGCQGKRSWEKFIPETYLMSSAGQRSEVLRGLMDTDGACSSSGHVEYSTTSPALADGVKFLVLSLGGKCTVRQRVTHFRHKGERKPGRLSYRLSARIPGLNPFHLSRKAERYNTAIGWTYDRVLVSVEPLGVGTTVCFKVDHPSRTFLARDLLVTHNSEVGVIDTILRCEGWHPYVKHRGPVTGWVVTLDWDMGVGQILWPKFKKYINQKRVKVGWLRRAPIEVPAMLKFPNGSELYFKSAEAGREKFQGASLHFAWVDEEQDGGLVEETRARLVDHGGDLLVTLTPVARKAWVRDLERETHNGKPTTKVVRASMLEAARAGILNLEAVERMLANLPARQRAVRERGDYAAIEGLVYPDFSRATHVCTPVGTRLVAGDGQQVAQWPLPKDWRRFSAIDFGYANPTSLILAAEDPHTGRWFIERCYYAPMIRATRWADIAMELPPLVAPILADHQAFERAEFHARGAPTSPAKKDVVPGLEAVERAFMPMPDGKPRMMLVVDDAKPPVHAVAGRYDAHWLAWELENYRYPEPKEKHSNLPKDLPVKKDDHACDALRYLVKFLEDNADYSESWVPDTIEHKAAKMTDLIPPSPWAT